MRRYRPRHLARRIKSSFTPTRALALALAFVTVTSTVSLALVTDATDAFDDTVAVAGGSGATPIDVLDNDTVAAGGALTITEISGDFTGDVAIADGGAELTYEPAADFCGPDAFDYALADGLGGSDTATVTVEVTCAEENDVVEEAHHDHRLGRGNHHHDRG